MRGWSQLSVVDAISFLEVAFTQLTCKLQGSCTHYEGYRLTHGHFQDSVLTIHTSVSMTLLFGVKATQFSFSVPHSESHNGGNMLYLWLAIVFAFIALGLIIGRIEAHLSLKRRREELSKRTWKALRYKHNRS